MYNDATDDALSDPGTTYTKMPSPGSTLRNSDFGDSFTNGVDEPTIAPGSFLLQASWTGHRHPSEVLNFGVPGLRHGSGISSLAHARCCLRPAVVVFGLQIENVKRNVNLLRPRINRFTDLPFAKPRFVAREGQLELINVPASPPTGWLARLPI